DHSPALEQAATAHSEDMVRHDYFGLESPTPGRKTLEQRLAPLNLSKAALGQTIGIGIMLAYEEGRPVYT
ncbi:MAG: CAP domain-containing protein, partial [Gammaproteobacteria bacterium]|nr:CAP domain-containing protein [Gammaproteobacteria bacterium]NIR97632.1 CAP domain-containing protein [Gammaproteobacteria bacterium]NIT63280.1 CAP domain-containing protein [Gammaproteobacteria bacterium]NIV20212.1 hypothetical protein [Gammaproteobacteria bacterium]NIX10612.1 hypothetical protein [Gammaproteobacteria bacterium]